MSEKDLATTPDLDTVSFEFDFESFKDSDNRRAFLREVLSPSGSRYSQQSELCSTPLDSLNSLIEYIEYLVKSLEEAGFDDESAVETAAITVYSSMSDFLKTEANTTYHTGLEELDQEIRELYDLDPRIHPRTHESPLVAEFYNQLEPHLSITVPGDRRGPWESW